MYDLRQYAEMTVREYRDIDEMVAEIRKPGDVYVTVNGTHDSMSVRAVKSDLVERLQQMEGDDHGWALTEISYDDGSTHRNVSNAH